MPYIEGTLLDDIIQLCLFQLRNSLLKINLVLFVKYIDISRNLDF